MKISEDFRYLTKDTKIAKNNTRVKLIQGKSPNSLMNFSKPFENDAEINRLKAKLSEITKNKSSFYSVSKEKKNYTPFVKSILRSNSEQKGIFIPEKPVYQIRSKLVAGPLSNPSKLGKNLPKTFANPLKNPANIFKSREKLPLNLESPCDSSYSISGWDFN